MRETPSVDNIVTKVNTEAEGAAASSTFALEDKSRDLEETRYSRSVEKVSLSVKASIAYTSRACTVQETAFNLHSNLFNCIYDD